MARWFLTVAAALAAVGVGSAQEKIFSGPQPCEKLPPFKVRGVFDAEAGKDLDFVTKAAGKPILLVFVHDANRPSIGLTRVVSPLRISGMTGMLMRAQRQVREKSAA